MKERINGWELFVAGTLSLRSSYECLRPSGKRRRAEAGRGVVRRWGLMEPQIQQRIVGFAFGDETDINQL